MWQTISKARFCCCHRSRSESLPFTKRLETARKPGLNYLKKKKGERDIKKGVEYLCINRMLHKHCTSWNCTAIKTNFGLFCSDRRLGLHWRLSDKNVGRSSCLFLLRFQYMRSDSDYILNLASTWYHRHLF